MLGALIVNIVQASCRRPWLTLLLSFVVALGCGAYAAKYFAINTNTDDLISSKLEWRQNQIAFNKAFPTLTQNIIVVIDAPTPELSQLGAEQLQAALAQARCHPECRTARWTPFLSAQCTFVLARRTGAENNWRRAWRAGAPCPAVRRSVLEGAGEQHGNGGPGRPARRHAA